MYPVRDTQIQSKTLDSVVEVYEVITRSPHTLQSSRASPSSSVFAGHVPLAVSATYRYIRYRVPGTNFIPGKNSI